MYKLVIADDEGKTTVVPLVRDEITIGRKEGNTIRLTERNVSRRHARLRKENGSFVVEDLGSYNGVKVNGRKIDGPAQLNNGDQLTIGDYMIALQVDATAAPGRSAKPAPPPKPHPHALAGGEAAATVPPPRLVMLTPPAPGAEYALTKARMTLGRAEDLDVWVNHRSISREHAQLVQQGDGYKVMDNGSANGVRVNGEEISEAILGPGDVLELGQVRFRFVGAGETYVFDADSTVQMGALEADEERGSRAPVLTAAAILLVAIGVGTAIAVSGGGTGLAPGEASSSASGDGLAAEADDKGSDPEGTTDELSPTRRVAVSEAAKGCDEALASQRYGDAIEQADIALSHDPGHDDAKRCRSEAEARQAESDAFARGKKALEDGDVDSAYFAFEELPEDSDYRDRPEVADAMEQFAERHVTLGRESLRRDLHEAARHADMVRTMQDPPQELLARANRIQRLARRRRSAAASASAGGSSGSASSDSSGTDSGATGDEEAEGGGGSASGGAASGPSPVEEAVECMKKGDNQCVIRLLEGKARTPRGLALLIETYRTVDNEPAARRNMRLFIRRHPTDNRAARYRQMLESD